jgi:RimJ/RimL family protein N-acetyltransferase
VYLLPEEQHIATPAGSSPYDPNLEFPNISRDAIVGTPIGNAGMKSDYGIGYLIAYEYWGKGYAAEAVAGILREFWRGAPEGRFGTVPQEEGDNDHKGKAYVTSMTYPENKASARVLEKVGGVDTGLIEMEDWSQKPEEKERDGVRKFKLKTYRMYEPDRHS